MPWKEGFFDEDVLWSQDANLVLFAGKRETNNRGVKFRRTRSFRDFFCLRVSQERV